MKELDEVIADAFAEARTLENNAAGFSVDRARTILKEIQEAAEPFITWLSEGDAAMRRGVTVQTMASYFPAMERDSNARMNGRVRQYRMCAVSRRANTSEAAARARAAARQEVKA